MSLKMCNSDEPSLGPQLYRKAYDKEPVPTFSHYHPGVKTAHSFQWPWLEQPLSYNLLV